MADLLSLKNQADLSDQAGNAMQGGARQLAAVKASDLFKSGKISSALSVMAAVDPDHVSQMIQQFQAMDPASQGALHQAQAGGIAQGTGDVQTAGGYNPRQLAELHNKGLLDAATAKKSAAEDSTSTFTDKLSGLTGFKSKSGKILGYVGPDGGLHAPDEMQGLTKQSDQTDGEKSPLRPHQDVNSEGKVVTIQPSQEKIIKDARKTFDSETKKIVEGLESAHTAQALTESNNAGGEPLERLRLLKTVTPRPSQQEFQAFGQNMGAIDSLENRLQKIGNGKMTPEIQKDYLAIINLMTKKLGDEYDAHLQNAVERTPDIDPLILKKRLVGSSGPTAYQSITKKVSTLPPDDQAAFNWAHDNPSDPRAKTILKNLSPQLGK